MQAVNLFLNRGVARLSLIHVTIKEIASFSFKPV